MLAHSIEHAREQVSSLQKTIERFRLAGQILPELNSHGDYCLAREKLLRQLLHQATSLASWETQEMVAKIKRLAGSGQLNRGLSLSLPYFDDETLKMKLYDFKVIPAGRILFESYYVSWVALHEEEQVLQNPGLSPVARRQLLAELMALEKAFEVPDVPHYRLAPRKKRPIQNKLANLRLAFSTKKDWYR
jgi:hypothetical protein